MTKFLFSRSASWSVPLVRSLVLTSCRSTFLPAVVALLPALGPLYPAVVALLPAVCQLFYFLLSVHRPVLVFVSPLVRAATVRHVLRHATLLARARLLESLLSTSCSPVHVLTHVFISWSAGCVTSLRSLLHCALRVESLLSVALEASCCCPHGTP